MSSDLIKTDFCSIFGKSLVDISFMGVTIRLQTYFFSSLFLHLYPFTTFYLKKKKKQFHWIQVLTDSEHNYWKTNWNVL